MPTVPERLPFRTAYQLGSFTVALDWGVPNRQHLARQGLWLSLTGFFSFDCNWLQFVTDSFFYLCDNQT